MSPPGEDVARKIVVGEEGERSRPGSPGSLASWSLVITNIYGGMCFGHIKFVSYHDSFWSASSPPSRRRQLFHILSLRSQEATTKEPPAWSSNPATTLGAYGV